MLTFPARGRRARCCFFIQRRCCCWQRQQRRRGVKWRSIGQWGTATCLLLLLPTMGSGPASTCHCHLPPDRRPPSAATICQHGCCRCSIHHCHLPPSRLLLHCPPPVTYAKMLPLAHCCSNLLLTLPVYIALSAAAGKCHNHNLGSSPLPQPLPPLHSCCCHCCDLLHTLCQFSLLYLPQEQPPPAATIADPLTTPPTRHHRWTIFATTAGLQPHQLPLPAPTPLLPLPPCHWPPPPAACLCCLCHLTPAFVDCCIFDCPILSLVSLAYCCPLFCSEIFQSGCQQPSIFLAGNLRYIFTVEIYGGTNCPPIQKNILPQFLHLQELLESFSKIHRKNVTLLEKKGTLCPPPQTTFCCM